MPFRGAGEAVSPQGAARSRSRSPTARVHVSAEERPPEFNAGPTAAAAGSAEQRGRPAPEPEVTADASELLPPAPGELEGDGVLRAKRAPHEPTPAERAEHAAANHSVYRSWCRACVAGRGKADPHVAQDLTSDQVPRVGIDYGYLEGKLGQPNTDEVSASPILFTRRSKT